MSAQGSPLPVSARGPRTRSAAPTVAFTLAVVVAAGAACMWAADRAATADRPIVTVTGALCAALLGLSVALSLSRHRIARELRLNTEVLLDDAARTVALHAEAARRATAELAGAQRAVREARVRRRTSAESEASLRTALRAETARAAALEGETARLAEVTIPLAVDRLRSGGSADTVLSRLPQPASAAHQRLLDVLIHEIGASERMRAAGMAACASAASRVQALTTGMLADLRELEQHHDERVLGDLLRLDHCTAQAGRLADSVAVLTGARSGRRWTKPIVTESVLRGAVGRIHAYQRVRLHAGSGLAVAGHAAEGVMHALAELMDNACNFSPPTEEVHVYVQETNPGLVVIIEDAGLAMPDATLVRAEKLVSGDPLDVRSLSGTRLGLAVVGCLARKYGLTVSFRPSSRGGTGVVVLIPAKIVVRVPEGHEGYEDGPEADGGPAYPERGARGGAGAGGRPGPRERESAAPPAQYTGDPAAPYAGDPAVPARPRERSPAHARPASSSGPAGAVGPAGPSGAYPWDPAGPSGAVPWDPAGPGVPVPPPPGRPPVPLPKRARGQTLAASQHGDLTADPSAAWLDPSPEDEARAARARAAAGARFSAFREAATGRERAADPVSDRDLTAEHTAARRDEAAAADQPTGTADRTAEDRRDRTAGDRTTTERGRERERGAARDSGRRGAEHTGAAEGPRDRTDPPRTPPRTPPGGTDTVSAGGDTGR
jgi:signal transduction histidine kinase